MYYQKVWWPNPNIFYRFMCVLSCLRSPVSMLGSSQPPAVKGVEKKLLNKPYIKTDFARIYVEIQFLNKDCQG